jgi:hypothetical protein
MNYVGKIRVVGLHLRYHCAFKGCERYHEAGMEHFSLVHLTRYRLKLHR